MGLDMKFLPSKSSLVLRFILSKLQFCLERERLFPRKFLSTITQFDGHSVSFPSHSQIINNFNNSFLTINHSKFLKALPQDIQNYCEDPCQL